MKLIDQINGSALFAQSAYSASTATKDSLGRDITATYLTGVNLPESATWNETSNVVSSNSAQWSEGKTYEGVSPIVVNNNENKISADTWTLSAGDGISFTDDSANKVTRIDVTAQGGDEGVNSFVHDNSATIIDVNSSYQSNSATWNEVSAKVDTTALIPTIDSNTITYSSKPTDNPIYASDNDLKNVNSIQGKSNLAIVPSGVLQVPNVITAAQSVLQVQNAITATNGNLIVPNAITAVPNNALDVPGVITSNPGGITANGLSANTNYGLTANGLTADALHSSFSANGISAGKQGPFIIQGSHESISSNNGVGFVFSSDNTNFNSAILTTAGTNNTVGMPAPMFEARNISGAGFSIEASGAKGYDKSGNVVWDTSNPQVKNIISYGDTKTAQGGLNGNIILTTQPSTNASNLTSSPYVIMDAMQASYFAAYGPSAQTPTVKMAPDAITFAYPVGNSGKTTVGYNDIKQECSGSSWTLTGSIQKRELEYDASTSAITAINGSALAGQGGGCGGSVSSKYGTISVDGSNIEATNKAIKFNRDGFTSSFDIKVVDGNAPVVFNWDNYSQDTSIHVEAFNVTQEVGTLTYSSNTNVTGEVTAAAYNSLNFDVQAPNATAIQFTTDKSFELQYTRVSAPSSFKVSELAWKRDLPTYEYNRDHRVSAINGSALVGNEDYLLQQGFVQNLTSPKGTVSVLNNNKIEGTNSAIASDVIEGFVSAYNGVSVYPGQSATLTWDRYVPNTMLFVSGAEYSEHTLTYSADTGVTGVITTTTGGQVSIELPTDSKSIVIGHENWSNINFNFTVSADNYYEIGELAWASALPTYEYDSTNKISAINGSAIAGGSDIPSGTMNVSGLEYNAVNEISGYNGSAIAQPTLSSLNTANVNNIIVTASLPSTPDANTLYLIPEV